MFWGICIFWVFRNLGKCIWVVYNVFKYGYKITFKFKLIDLAFFKWVDFMFILFEFSIKEEVKYNK